jgi:hypothetical protein
LRVDSLNTNNHAAVLTVNRNRIITELLYS